ncbi:Cdc25 phosphatase Ibp1 [Rhodotorula kratochvilovae]
MSTASGPKLKYIKPDTVAELIRAGETRRPEFLVIDVRSSDFPGGNLPGAVNITTREFRDDAAMCTRGPYAAHLLSRSPSLPPDVEVVVLEGGFQGWLRRYKGEKVLFEGLDGAAQGWEDVVQAEEGSTLEAEDSRRLREGRA